MKVMATSEATLDQVILVHDLALTRLYESLYFFSHHKWLYYCNFVCLKNLGNLRVHSKTFSMNLFTEVLHLFPLDSTWSRGNNK
jgi:hypothetical protein